MPTSAYLEIKRTVNPVLLGPENRSEMFCHSASAVLTLRALVLRVSYKGYITGDKKVKHLIN